jgi:type IV pilus assembly protein PilO
MREEAEQFYNRIPVNLAVSGKYHQLAKFFYNVSRLQRAINMENIVIGTPKLQGEDLVLQVHVLATTFRRKDA